MKNPLSSFPDFFATLGGGIAASQAISFGWYYEGSQVGSILRNHSVILFLAGLGLVGAGHFIRRSSSRIAALEQQVALLMQKKG